MGKSAGGVGFSWGIRWAWPLWLLGALLLTGTGIGGYLTWHHENELYGDSSVTLANCPENALVNCEIVNSSRYSELFGVPIALFAIPTYLLLLGLLLYRRKDPKSLGWVFGIGCLTTLYSVYLAYISHFWVGYLCLWCLRLYFINFSIPVLVWVSLWKNPFRALPSLKADFHFKTPAIRLGAVGFVVLLAVSITSQRLYRAGLSKTPTIKSHSGDDLLWKSSGFRLPASLKQGQLQGERVILKDFDLQARVGKGRPLALIYLSPGMTFSERAAVEFARFFKSEAPQFEVYGIVGVKGDYRPEMAMEIYRSLPGLKDVPLLFDVELAYLTRMGVDVPSVAVIDKDGSLVASRMKLLSAVTSPSGSGPTGKDILLSVARGEVVAPIKQFPPTYPSSELIGKCAPSFELTDLKTGKRVSFTGKSTNGKPTLLVFWRSTCMHCQKELPQMVAHQKKHPGEYNIVSVTDVKLDRETDGFSPRVHTLEFAKQAGIEFPILADGGAVSEMYQVISTPTSYIIAADGTIQQAWHFVHTDIDKAFEQAMRTVASTSGTCAAVPAKSRAQIAFDVISPKNQKVPLPVEDGLHLVHFWATWCGPCQKEFPHLLKFVEESKGAVKLTLVSVEDESDGPKIANFLKQHGSKWASYRAPQGGIAADLNLSYSVPRTLLLNKKGELLRPFYGVQKWEQADFKDRVYSWANTK